MGLCELPLNAIASDQAGGMGGTCVLRGCIPKKFMVYAGEFTDECQDAEVDGRRMNRHLADGRTWIACPRSESG